MRCRSALSCGVSAADGGAAEAFDPGAAKAAAAAAVSNRLRQSRRSFLESVISSPAFRRR
jgi:hypothetical protein